MSVLQITMPSEDADRLASGEASWCYPGHDEPRADDDESTVPEPEMLACSMAAALSQMGLAEEDLSASMLEGIHQMVVANANAMEKAAIAESAEDEDRPCELQQEAKAAEQAVAEEACHHQWIP